MKKLLAFLIILGLSAIVMGYHVSTANNFMVKSSVLDTPGVAEQVAESIHIETYFEGFNESAKEAAR